MKRIVAWCLLVILIVGTFASCTTKKNENTSNPTAESVSEDESGSGSLSEEIVGSGEPTDSFATQPSEYRSEQKTDVSIEKPTESSTESESSSEKNSENFSENSTVSTMPSQSQTSTEAPTESENESKNPTDEVTELPTAKEELTEAQTESERASEEKTEPSVESESAYEQPSEPQGERTDPAESMTETPSEGQSENTEENVPIGTLNEELAKVGITGYDAYKLMLISLYYDLYYIGGTLPNARQIATSMRTLFDQYFPDIDTDDQDAMTTAAILCYQQAVGDRYATYFDEESYREQQTDQNAEFVGIGVYVSYHLQENSVQVLSVFKGTPAAEAGILPGDYIVSVDGVGIEEIGYSELVNRIRGEVDSYVTVGIVRNGEELSFTMQRKAVEGVSVTYRQLSQDETIGYVKIEQFDSKTAEQFRKAIDDLLDGGVEGLIFDLRGNPGGEVGSIVDVLDYLLPDGKTIAYFRYDEDISSIATVYTASDGHEVTLPMTVLCDGYTASAGELFTAALRDHEAATVIGVTTYGKGTAQSLLDLGDGTAFTISTARYDPPSGENYEGVGITPHIVVELSEEAAAVNAFLRDDSIDNQLQTAVAEIDRLRKETLQ